MNLVRNRWVYSLLFGAVISVAVGGIVNSLAPVAIAQESAEETASAAEASPEKEEKAADETTPAEATDGDATAEALAAYIQETLRLEAVQTNSWVCLLYTSPSPRDQRGSRMPAGA